MSVNIEFYQRLRELRKVKDLSQKEVADALNINYIAYAHKEAGTHPITLEELSKLAKVFDVSVSELVINVEPTLLSLHSLVSTLLLIFLLSPHLSPFSQKD